MTITTTTLTRAAGLAAVAGGLLFIAVQFKHPVLDAAFTTTTEYTVRETAKIFMAVFSLIGITGIYLRQVRQTGVLGLIGYLLLGLGYLAILTISHCRVRPPGPRGQSAWLRQRRSRSRPQPPPGRRRQPFQPLTSVGFAYIVGGIVFGIALFRAGILARWAAALLTIGAVATIATSSCPSSSNGCSPFPSASP